MDYTERGFDEFLTRSEVNNQLAFPEVDIAGFDQFTSEMVGTKLVGGRITSQDGKIIFDLDNNNLSISDTTKRVEIGDLSDGSKGLLIKDDANNTLMSIAGTVNVLKSANSSFNLDLNTGKIDMSTLLNFRPLANGTTLISLKDAPYGKEKIKIEINSGGFGFITANQYFFTSNTGNSLKENFGVVAQLADSAGSHAFRIYDRDNNPVWVFASNGEVYQKKSAFVELLGNIADPGGGPANSARIFVQENGGKDQLRVEFATGASVLIAAEP